MKSKILLLSLILLEAQIGLGCLVCHSLTGQQVQSGLFNSDFLATLGQVTSPFLILGMGVAVAYFWSFQR